MLKHCKKCDTVKPLDEFYKCSHRADGKSWWCKECAKSYHKRTYDRDRNWEYQIKCLYNLSASEYSLLLEKQGGKCKVCGSTEPKVKHGRFVVDHCHGSGKVRGLLCNDCNLMLGKAHDSIETLTAAIKYLEENA